MQATKPNGLCLVSQNDSSVFPMHHSYIYSFPNASKTKSLTGHCWFNNERNDQIKYIQKVMIGGHPTPYHTHYFNEVEGIPWVWGGGPSIITLFKTNVALAIPYIHLNYDKKNIQHFN